MVGSLVVLDLDTALIGAAGTLDRVDRDALLRARAEGTVLAFASSRRFASIGMLLRTHGLDGWIIGCDGAELGVARGERVMSRNTIASAIALRSHEVLRAHGLEPLALTGSGVHGPPARADAARKLIGEAADTYIPRAPLLSEVHALVASGPENAVERARSELSMLAPTRVRAATYQVEGEHSVRVDACRSTRARAIRDLVARVKVRRPSIAYVGAPGTGYVDRSPFEELAHVYLPAGVSRSVAPQAETLQSPAGAGAVAEALERWARACSRDERTLSGV